MFNLAKELGLEVEKSALVNSTTSENTSEHAMPVNKVLPITRHFRQVEIKRTECLEVNASNDDGLPTHYYKADNLTLWKSSHSAVECLRYKYSDAVWIKTKLRRVQASKRPELTSEYSTIYERTSIAEENPIKKHNHARFIANSWLLKVTR